MATQTNRVKQLDRAKNVVADLEAELDSTLSQPRRHLSTAGDYINHDNMYHEYLEQAMGRVAGMAIKTGYDDIAATAAELVESPEIDDQ